MKAEQFTYFLFSSRRRHTRCSRDWSSDVCSSDLEMADKQDRFALPGASKAHHEILFAVARPGNVKIIFGKPCVAKSLGHGFGGGGYVAHGVGGVDLDELLKNVTRHLIGGTHILCPRPPNGNRKPDRNHHTKKSFFP